MENAAMNLEILKTGVLIVGTGAAGYNAADRLFSLGVTDLLVVSENRLSGTSRNAGSDKQTYYKLTLSGNEPDSVREMAEELFKGGAVDGDHALAEAALSVRGFFNLVEAGVPFPRTDFGEFPGYKTDHDPHERATSAGPYTSRMMTEALEKRVLSKDIPVRSGLQLIELLKLEARVCGGLFLDLTKAAEGKLQFTAVLSDFVILATGGPAGIYKNTVYPLGQIGATGTAFRAGVFGKNLTEWQFGLASLKPRWNVSGTYMQVLPRFVSTKADGTDPQEFLLSYFPTLGDCLSKVFLKGYQWPFDVRKMKEGSSVIDLLVFNETKKGRRVFLDFRENPGKKPVDFESLSKEAYAYLEKTGALFGTPIDRLLHMNAPAYEFYLEHGVDLQKEPLEIGLCAQHNNGGLSVDGHWETNVSGLYACGECAGTHGITRPGGSALNSGQAGSLQAAMHIAARRKTEAALPQEMAELRARETAQRFSEAFRHSLSSTNEGAPITEILNDFETLTDRAAGAFRSREGLQALILKTHEMLTDYATKVKPSEVSEAPAYFRLYDLLVAENTYASAMLHYINNGGLSRGSALYPLPGKEGFPEVLETPVTDGRLSGETQEIEYLKEGCEARFRPVRPIPELPGSFETVWAEFRKKLKNKERE